MGRIDIWSEMVERRSLDGCSGGGGKGKGGGGGGGLVGACPRRTLGVEDGMMVTTNEPVPRLLLPSNPHLVIYIPSFDPFKSSVGRRRLDAGST